MEIWKEYPGDSRYHISNLGRVKSFCYSEHRIKQPVASAGNYLRVTIGTKQRFIHHLVWDTFGSCPRDKIGYEINHINHIRTDNRIENLEYITREKNRQNNSSKFEGTQMKYLTKNRNGYSLRIQRNHTFIINKWFRTLEEACEARDTIIFQPTSLAETS